MADEQIAAAGYVVTYFNDVETMTNETANYINLLNEIKQRSKGSDTIELQEENTQVIEQLIPTLRFYVVRTYVKTISLASRMESLRSPRLDELYQKIKYSSVPEAADIEEYCFELNKLFVQGVVSSIIDRAWDYYSQLSRGGE